ncbi:unnamed protein product [Fusarium graminearum]|nr:unnamed protein product [Fusarium graminearum]
MILMWHQNRASSFTGLANTQRLEALLIATMHVDLDPDAQMGLFLINQFSSETLDHPFPRLSDVRLAHRENLGRWASGQRS